MNPKIVIADLKLYREYKFEIREANAALEKNRLKKERLAQPGTVSYSSDPKVRQIRSKDSYLIDLIDEERYYRSRRDKFEAKVREVDTIIKNLPKETREIVTMKYIKGASWSRVIAKFNYSRSHMDRIIRKDLSEIKGIFYETE